VSTSSHLTERHSINLLKLPLPEAEDSRNTLLVPYWCHLVSGYALIIFHLSSNSPETDCCFIFSIISFYLSCFLSFTNYLTGVDYHFTYTNLYITPTTTISPIRICTKYQRLPFHLYEFVQNIRNHELPGYFQRHLPSCGRNEYMVLFHYHPSG